MDKCENKKKPYMRLKHFQAEVKIHCNIRGFCRVWFYKTCHVDGANYLLAQFEHN